MSQLFRVLVVDDDADLRRSIAAALADARFHVESASDGEEDSEGAD